MLDGFTKKSSACDVAKKDDGLAPLQRLELEEVTGHQSTLVRGGTTAVKYDT